MNLKKIIIYDELTISIKAPKNLTPERRRRVIRYARTIRASLAEFLVEKTMPIDLLSIVHVSVY